MRYHLLAVVAATLLAMALPVRAQAPDYTRYQGRWSGSFLFYVTQPDTGGQGPPEVHPGVLLIEVDGSVHGHIPEAACTLAGSSMDYITSANASIDLVASGCRDLRFNGHFVGRLITNAQLRYASIRLSSMRSLDSGSAQISAIIRH
ncbi:hypothetical protein QTH87_11170 [Variovorax sp. J22P168]|uniref:hypothetical protein n=1 Tax=Variovorax jilinensis TaxID=3053513 RepID=UPI002576A0A0|nr:hypothetical protein [Variovorax sp. J22P168]MDM0012992.1 hypothetical protein [Variovorax sp. J22P168]